MAKNSMFLYIRSFAVLLISLYSSRIVLSKLGVTDFGVFQVVGGVVGVLAFFTSSLNSAGSRFLTYELGKNNPIKVNQVFSTLMAIHIGIVILLFLFAETFGLWFVKNKVGIADDMIEPAVLAYHFSIVTAAFAFLQVPFVSFVIAKEEMDIFAWLSIAWAASKLIVAFLIGYFVNARLPLYAAFLSVAQILISLSYFIFCFYKYPELKIKIKVYRESFRDVFSYTGWSTISSFSRVLNLQGINIITNIFFSPVVVASRAISVQVNSAISTLYSSFSNSINPQIIKRYAAGDYVGSKKLLLVSCRYSFFIVFFTGLPVILVARKLLEVWLGQVPEYSVIFLQLIVIESFMSIFDACFSTALTAKGQIKENSIISPIVLFLKFPIVYYLFKNGSSPVVLSYVGIISYFIMSWLIKPILLNKICGYEIRDFIQLFLRCVYVIIIPVLVSLFLMNNLSMDSLISCIVVCTIVSVVNIFSIFFLGVDQEHRKLVLRTLKSKYNNFKIG